MAPLIVLVVVTALARVVGALGVGYVDSLPEAMAVGLAAMFAMTCSIHFVEPRRSGLVAIVPPVIPKPALAVTLTGILEAAGAVALLIPPEVVPGLRVAAAVGLLLLLIAMFPANVYAAGEVRHPAAPHTPLLQRSIIQVVFVIATLIVAVGSFG